LLGHSERCVERIAETLDRMDAQNRLWTMLSIEPKEQAALWKLVADRPPLGAEHFVPSGSEPLKQVIHHGKNSLPVNRYFQKRFALASDDSGELWGYNHQPMAWATGPGYFVAHPSQKEDAPAKYVIDYTRIPPNKPQGWPDVVPNEARLGRLVYSGMKDYMRAVSEHVSIGRAYKRGKPMNAWFVLCRDDTPEV
jgi:hypothetical protein